MLVKKGFHFNIQKNLYSYPVFNYFYWISYLATGSIFEVSSKQGIRPHYLQEIPNSLNYSMILQLRIKDL